MRGLLLSAVLPSTALLNTAALAGCSAAQSAPAPAAHTVYLNFSSGHEGVTLGARDAASSNVSELCAAPVLAPWSGLEECGGRAECASIVRELVADHFVAYDVAFTLERPPEPPYGMVMIAPFEADCSFGRLGVAATDCGDENPESLAFVFGCASSAVECAALIAHEVGHLFGLVHVASASDLMTLAPELPGLQFVEAAAPVIDDECGLGEQSSHRALLDALGGAASQPEGAK